MFKRATPIGEFERFADLPVRLLTPAKAGRHIAIHLRGRLPSDMTPLVCLPGYVRNMLDFAALTEGLTRYTTRQRPIVLLDLAGRARSAPLGKKDTYSTLRDAEDTMSVLAALGINRAILLGQGHGGQVAMLIARRRPGLLRGTILVDSGPVSDPRSLVRLRNNLAHLSTMRGAKPARTALRKIMAADYPGESEARLDALAERVYWLDRKDRVQPLFDRRLVEQLQAFDYDDVLEPQWPLFACLDHVPLMLVRTEYSDQLRRETFDAMMRRRQDAHQLMVPGQGSPALFDDAETISALDQFLEEIDARRFSADHVGFGVDEAVA